MVVVVIIVVGGGGGAGLMGVPGECDWDHWLMRVRLHSLAQTTLTSSQPPHSLILPRPPLPPPLLPPLLPPSLPAFTLALNCSHPAPAPSSQSTS